MKKIFMHSLAASLFVIKSWCQSPTELYNTRLSAEQRIASAVLVMTLEEKIKQMQYLAPAIPRLNIPAYNWWNEGLHGVAYNGKATCFPQAIGMAATWDTALIHKEADIISTEARAKYYEAQYSHTFNNFGGLPGLTFWSPNINIFRDPRWGRGQETYGEDPYLTASIAYSFITGLQGNNPNYFKTIATPKHYAVHSGPEPQRYTFDAVVSKRDFYETYLPAFEASVIKAGAGSVMGAYNSVYGSPCCASNLLLEEILRNKWHFKGYVVSDCGAITQIVNGHKVTTDKAMACALAVKAGCDLTCGEEYLNLKEAVAKGYIMESQIDTSVSRLLMARIKLGLFDTDSKTNPYNSILPTEYDTETSRGFARTVAQKSMVLLKNKNDLLPLSPFSLKKVAVIGPYIKREDILLGNYHALPSRTVTFLQGVVNAIGAGKVLFSEGVIPWDNSHDKKADAYDFAGHTEAPDSIKNRLHNEAISIAKRVDVIIAFMGISPNLEGESMPDVSIEGFFKGDRTTIDLPKNQQQLLKDLKATGKPIVLVLTGGSGLALNWEKQNIPAILQAWYPGEEGGNAAADIIFGTHNPAGRLPITFYKSLTDLPQFEDYNMTNRTYRYFKGKPLYPFGHGLTYTKFVYSPLRLSKMNISASDSLVVQLTIKNVGKYDGDEVVQLYVRQVNSAQPQPIKNLKGFARVSIKKGEVQNVSFSLKASDFKYYDEQKNDFIVEAAQYEIQIGSSSQDIKQKKIVRIKP